MDEKARVISRDQYLKGLGIFTMAEHHHSELRKYEKLLGKVLGINDEHGFAGRLSDSIYQEEDYDQGLKYCDIVVKAEPTQQS